MKVEKEMDEPKHTPGPWVPAFDKLHRVLEQVDGGQVAIMVTLKCRLGMGGQRADDEVAANARLIAAAPELLEALVAVHGELTDKQVAFESLPLVEQAIAKALGKANV